VLLRDVSPTPTPLIGSIRSAVEAVLGPALSGFCCVEKLTGIAGSGRRQRALATVRSQLQRELGALGETAASLPCLETLRSVFGHFRDCFDHTIDRPVQLSGGLELQPQGRIGMVLASLLDNAEAQAGTNLRAVVFPVSEAANEFAMLKAKEKRLLEDSDGAAPDDAQIAELSSQLRALESSRRALLSQPVTPLVRFFVEAVLGQDRLQHARVVEFGLGLAAWRNPRLAPLMDRRRQLLDERLRLAQEHVTDGDKYSKKQEDELNHVAQMLADAEKALEQLNISLDLFWGELAAISDLATDLQGLGIRPPPDTPSSMQLKTQFAEWAWQLNVSSAASLRLSASVCRSVLGGGAQGLRRPACKGSACDLSDWHPKFGEEHSAQLPLWLRLRNVCGPVHTWSLLFAHGVPWPDAAVARHRRADELGGRGWRCL